ncbi:hypothetical protein CN307_10690 [Bacillus cereus]|uniref:Uncharacterized protein n=1 Tax=Bacillus cereus TaxID=1396 RepID=A0A2A9A1P1_BACCE|nr:hypothetical protein CN307_10690 [Bacillus cereus]
MRINILENINNASELLLVISAFCFYMYLRKIKLTRKLTRFAISMYIVSQLAYVLWGITLIAKIWG